MKLKTLIMLLLFIISRASAQPITDIKYKRSSLYTLIVHDAALPHAEVIKGAFLNYPIPDKFNDHNLKTRIISGKTAAKDQYALVKNFVDTNAVGRNIVSKWFNRNEQGAFNMNLIGERGFYNASEMDIDVANMSKRGRALLEDAGEELIKNTFLLVSDFKYVPDSVIMQKAKAIRNISNRFSKVAGGIGGLGGLTNTASTAMDIADNFEGYFILTTSYLFRLDWNDSIASVFYNDYWIDDKSIDSKRKVAFESSTIFTLNYIGKEEAWAMVHDLKVANKPEDVLIKKATINALDAAIVKLQKNHEEFRTKTPLYSNDPLSAQIGMKEGLEANDKYEVFEQTMNEEGKTSYDSKGFIYVDKKQIWDNRYTGEADTSKIDRTLFRGGNKKLYPGMLIRQK